LYIGAQGGCGSKPIRGSTDLGGAGELPPSLNPEREKVETIPVDVALGVTG
jgi:hypothetical protein